MAEHHYIVLMEQEMHQQHQLDGVYVTGEKTQHVLPRLVQVQAAVAKQKEVAEYGIQQLYHIQQEINVRAVVLIHVHQQLERTRKRGFVLRIVHASHIIILQIHVLNHVVDILHVGIIKM